MKRKNLIFLIGLFFISKTYEKTVDEVWDYTLQKLKEKSENYFLMDPSNKISEEERTKAEKSMNNIFLKYGIHSYLFLIDEMENTEKFTRELMEKINVQFINNMKSSLISIVSIKDDYYYLSIGSENEWKIKSDKLNEIKYESEKEGYEKYFTLIVDKILNALYQYELDQEDIDYPWLDQDDDDNEQEEIEVLDDREYEKQVKEEYERRKKEEEEKKRQEENKNNKDGNLNVGGNKSYGLYIISFFMILTIIIVGLYVVHNYRRKLLKNIVSTNIDYMSITGEV